MGKDDLIENGYRWTDKFFHMLIANADGAGWSFIPTLKT
jgi:hypothetical protein